MLKAEPGQGGTIFDPLNRRGVKSDNRSAKLRSSPKPRNKAQEPRNRPLFGVLGGGAIRQRAVKGGRLGQKRSEILKRRGGSRIVGQGRTF